MIPLLFVVPVWGESYVRTFIDYCVPAQLAPGNIPSLRDSRHRYLIFTKQADHQRFLDSPVFQKLTGHIDVEFQFVDDWLGQDKYRINSLCYMKGLEAAFRLGAAAVLLNADHLIADGSVVAFERILATGKRVVEVPGPRAVKADLGEALGKFRTNDGAISVGATELSALWLKHIHPLLAMHFVEGEQDGPFHPAHLYWRVGNEGIIARCCQVYPIVVYPNRPSVSFNSTTDDDLVANLGFSSREIYLCKDSREVFACELSDPDHFVGTMARRGDLKRYMDFYLENPPHNRRNLEREILIPGVDQLGADWVLRRRESAAFVSMILRKCRGEELRRLYWYGVVGQGRKAAKWAIARISFCESCQRAMLDAGRLAQQALIIMIKGPPAQRWRVVKAIPRKLGGGLRRIAGTRKS
ncbi:hypothetical protein ACQR1W_34620 [Bradyrhizobium sp. HKCCYLS1011]|uniref:hypothetical protein n=1 Tax=Bradyrhizobium sp. HKCCYLS1011 TaxID=3420733 RepID=UPI003EB91387